MFAALLGPALSFGSSLLQGFGAQQSAKKMQKIQAAYEYQNYMLRQSVGYDILGKYNLQNIPKDAESAGFNPVTWLNAVGPTYGGLLQQGYGLISQGQNAPTAQVPSALEVVGGALSSGVSTFLADRRVAQSQDFQREMLQTQISAIQRSGGANRLSPSNPTFFGSGQIPYAATSGPTTVGVPRAATGLPLGLSEWKPDDVKVVNPWHSSTGYSVDPTMANADTFTQRYGDSELISTGFGIYVGSRDFLKNWKPATVSSGLEGVYNAYDYPVYPDGARGLSWGKPAQGSPFVDRWSTGGGF